MNANDLLLTAAVCDDHLEKNVSVAVAYVIACRWEIVGIYWKKVEEKLACTPTKVPDSARKHPRHVCAQRTNDQTGGREEVGQGYPLATPDTAFRLLVQASFSCCALSSVEPLW